MFWGSHEHAPVTTDKNDNEKPVGVHMEGSKGLVTDVSLRLKYAGESVRVGACSLWRRVRGTDDCVESNMGIRAPMYSRACVCV